MYLVLEEANSKASGRNLYLIGPHRADEIGSEVEGTGTVCSALSDQSEGMDLVASHVAEMIDPNGDLSTLAAEMVDAYIAATKEEADETCVSEFLDNFGDQIRRMLTEYDVLSALQEMRAGLLDRLGGKWDQVTQA